MRDFDILLRRIEKAGVTWEERPFRLHHQRHGQLQDTFFVWENSRSRTPLDTFVNWTVDTGRMRLTGVEACISKMTDTKMYRFVRGPLYLIKDKGSGYGTMLCVTDTPPQHIVLDLIAQLEPWNKAS